LRIRIVLVTQCDKRWVFGIGLAGGVFLLSACQQPRVEAADPAAQIREACADGDPSACQQLTQSSAPDGTSALRWAPDSRAEQVQRDVAAIIRGMRRSSASNGL
jgi:hypothetical protein